MRKAREKARDTQDAHRVFDEGRRDVAQHALFEISPSPMRVDQPAIRGLGHGINSQVTSGEILFEGHIGRELGDESAITRSGLALETRERIFLAALRVQEHREVTADGRKAPGLELLRSGADHHPVAFGDGAAQQCVAHCATDEIDVHALMLAQACRQLGCWQ